MLLISGELIVSRHVAESITTDAGCFGHVGLCQLCTKLRTKRTQFCMQWSTRSGHIGHAYVFALNVTTYSTIRCTYIQKPHWDHGNVWICGSTSKKVTCQTS